MDNFAPFEKEPNPPPGHQSLFVREGTVYLKDEHGTERALASGVQAVKVYLNGVLMECATKFDSEAGFVEYVVLDAGGLRIDRRTGKVRVVLE